MPKRRQGLNIFGTDQKQKILIKAGREQFSALIKKGIKVPVVLL